MSSRSKMAVLVSAALAMASIVPASAQPLRLAAGGLSSAAPTVTQVRYRARPAVRPPVVRPGVRPPAVRPGWRVPPGAWGPGAYRAGYGWYRPGWGWGYYNNTGAWIAAGIAGAAIGAAAIGAANAAAANNDAIAYCMQRFKSYDPRTGTYLGYDGLRHPCP